MQPTEPPWSLPLYTPPDFISPPLAEAPLAKSVPAPADGVLPENYHATSNHPEYLQLSRGSWQLVAANRMDAALVLHEGTVLALEARRVRKGDLIVLGRTENGEEGIYVHTSGFAPDEADDAGKFAFRTRGTRETPFSYSYDELYRILRHDRDQGYIAWVLGPAVAFDKDSRSAMQGLVEAGYCHALLAGNALAVHDLEAARFGTGLGQDIYTRQLLPGGHYHHLDLINEVRRRGSIPRTLQELGLDDGIIAACEKRDVPYVLASSIRDDGPLPEVLTDSRQAQDAMRRHADRATTVVALATQLHTIAFGNMVPNYRVRDDGTVRPVYFYVVDMSEFSVDKLANRGSTQTTAILTNVQDFLINLWHNLGGKESR